MPDILITLTAVIMLEYASISLSSLMAKIVITNFVKDLGEVSRSRETKNECLTVEKKIRARYKESLLWPVELWRVLKKVK